VAENQNLIKFFYIKVTKVLTVVIIQQTAVYGGHVWVQCLFCGDVWISNYGFV